MLKILLLFTVFLPTLFAQPVRFDFRDLGLRNLFVYESEGVFEKTYGVTHYLMGNAEVNLEDVSQGLQGEFLVDLRSVNTDLDIRNQFLRESIFQANLYPQWKFKFKKTATSPLKLTPLQTKEFKLEIETQWKETTHTVTVPVKMTYYIESAETKLRLPGNLLRFQGKLDLSQFKMNIPADQRSWLSANKSSFEWDMVGSDKLPLSVKDLPEGIKPKK